LWYLPKMNMSLFVIWATLLYITYLMLHRLLWTWAGSILLLAMFLHMHRRCDSISIAELRGLADLASCVLFVIKFFAIHPDMGPAQLVNTSWKSANRWPKQINAVRRCRIHYFNGWLYHLGHTEEARKSRNYNSQFAWGIQIWHLNLINNNWSDRQNAPN